ncbi:leucine-tRNA ligase [Exophiala spinifera]|uniref:leucine--tRNA ligase n=1 Tax=Exophiala spinifera TaxID=91928 RepID=A0A0D1ZSR5_9EURO|nr:leucine-tRNA ligase [Exophiala spinifera]KIW15857.1 leucine-tRNA ligase [Exophiala spinifera]
MRKGLSFREARRLNYVRPFSTSPSCLALSQDTGRLDFRAIDSKWQQRWTARAQAQAQRPKSTSPKSYILPMFAYPSGSLHMGHLRVYTISDVIARYRRMRGDQVLHPTGWDAFGLPAENAAIERGIDPAVWTEQNITKMKQQLKSMNTSFDWDAEISTCSPSFYKHTQSIFLKLFRHGLAYQAEALVNYDPVDKTVLANEQVDSNGRSWRSGALVQQVNLRQWFFRITEFKEALLQDLDYLSEGGRWPDRVVSQQRNWLGRSTGARIKFELRDQAGFSTPAPVFTTRPDTLYGVKFLALSMSHPLVKQLATHDPELQRFLDRRASFPPDSKEGFELPLKAVHPLSQEPLPVFTAPYVLEDYGEGAVMGVPAHDTRDLSFWKSHQPADPVTRVVACAEAEPEPLYSLPHDLSEAYTGHGLLTSACGPYAGMESRAAGIKIVSDLQKRNLAEPFETWKLRDWLVSRQRYWGTPIPIIHCPSCGIVPVPEEDLPVVLPPLDSSIKGQTGNPLDKLEEWVHCTCPQCRNPARRETDTMDTFVDSSWYFMRFPDPQNENQLCSQESAHNMLPVDIYIGGVEHAILHLLYARFIYKFLCKEGLMTKECGRQEPFQRLVAQGMVHGKTFSDPQTGRFLLPGELAADGDRIVMKSTGKVPNVTFEKMSKSKHNGVDPTTAIEKFGADTLRAHILFAAPVSEVLQWDEEKIVGIQRWLSRVRRLVADLSERNTSLAAVDGDPDSTNMIQKLTNSDADVLLLASSTSRNIRDTFENDIYSLNTAISDLTKLTNKIQEVGIDNLTLQVAQQVIHALLKMMAPITPAFAEECWEELIKNESEGSIFDEIWSGDIISPEQESVLKGRKQLITCAVQVNGKLRFTTEIPVTQPNGASSGGKEEREEAILKTILATDEGRLWLTEKNDWDRRKRVIVVGNGKVVNVVF